MKKTIIAIMIIFSVLVCSSSYASQLKINGVIVAKNLTKTQYQDFITSSLNCAIWAEQKKDQWQLERFIFLSRNGHLYYYNTFLSDPKKTKDENLKLETQQFTKLYLSQKQIINNQSALQRQALNDHCNKIKSEIIEFDD